MGSVYFGNQGLLELAAITNMGISVKNSDDAIGYFGTGLKYALAVLIREGAEVHLQTPGMVAEVFGEPITVKSKQFTAVKLRVFRDKGPMEIIDVGVTTHLGVNWTLKHAFRELYSNTLDEGGEVWVGSSIDAKAYETIIQVGLGEFRNIYANREEIFPNLSTKTLLYSNNYVQVFKHFSNDMFYKGVKVYEQKKSHFTYNFIDSMDLTEDRTLAHIWSANYIIEKLLPLVLTYEETIAMFQNANCFEHEFALYDAREASIGFIDAIKFGLKHLGLPPVYSIFLSRHVDVKNLYKDVTAELTKVEQKILDEAKSFLLKSLSRNLNDYPIIVMDTLGMDTVGKAANGTIYVSRDFISRGWNYMASTIYEEYIHLHRGLADNCYEMQTFLFDTIIHQETIRQAEEQENEK